MTDARTETIRFRCTLEERERYVDAAGSERGLSKMLREAVEHWITIRELEAAHYEISERDGDATGGLPDSTPIPTPESRGQVDAVAPAREVTPAPADLSTEDHEVFSIGEAIRELKVETVAVPEPTCTHPRALPGMRTCPQCFAVLVSE